MNKKNKVSTATASAPKDVSPTWFSFPEKEHYGKIFWATLASVFIVGFLLYANTIKHGYVLDDTGAIEQNLNVQKGISGIKGILSQDLWEFSEVRLGYYRPLSLISFAIEYEFFGAAPHVSHFNNVWLFALSGVFLFLMLHQLFSQYSRWMPLVITLLFMAHPIHTEVVANIKSRDEILSSLNLFIVLFSTLRHLKTSNKWWLVPMFFFAYLGMLSKETALTGLLLVPVFYYVLGKLDIGASLVRSWPIFLAIAVFFLQKRIALGSLEAIIPIDIVNYPYVPPHTEDFTRYPTAFYLFTFGIQLLLLPHPLRYDYSYNQIPAVDFGHPFALLGLALFAVGAFYTIKWMLNRDVKGIPFALFYVSIAPALAFTVLRGGIFAERFLYMAVLGFLLAIFIVIKEKYASKFQGKEVFAWGFGALLFLGYAYKTFERNKVWKDNYTLFANDIQTGMNSCQNHRHYAEQSLVKAMAEKDSIQKMKYVNQSLSSFYTSLKMHPKFAESYLKTAVIHQLFLNQPDSAIYYYRQCIACQPTRQMHAEAYYNLGTVYQNNKGNLVYASYCYNQSLAYVPGYPLATTASENLKKVGINQLLEPVDMNLDDFEGEKNSDYYFRLGYDQASKGDYKAAIESFEKVLKTNPSSLDAILNIGNCYGMLANYNKSIEYNNRLIQLYPNDIRAYNNNVVNYEKLGNTAKVNEMNQIVRKLKGG
jgi:protein O-mannosyl-transferase